MVGATSSQIREKKKNAEMQYIVHFIICAVGATPGKIKKHENIVHERYYIIHARYGFLEKE